MARRQSKVVVLAAVAALVAAAFSVVAGRRRRRLPDISSSGCANVHAGTGARPDWDDTDNWRGRRRRTAREVACVPASGCPSTLRHVVTCGPLHIDDGDGRRSDPAGPCSSTAPTVSSSTASPSVHGGTLGGTGRVVVNGLVEFAGGAVLTRSRPRREPPRAEPIGILDVPGA